MKNYLLILLSSILLALSFPGFISPYFLFIALIPSFIVYSKLSLKKSFYFGIVHSLIAYTIIYWWIIYSLTQAFKLNTILSSVITLFFVIILIAIPNGIFAVFSSYILKKIKSENKMQLVKSIIYIILLSLSWSLIESIRGSLLNMNTLTSCFYKHPDFIQSISITGEHIFSSIFIIINITLFSLYSTFLRKKTDSIFSKKISTTLIILSISLLSLNFIFSKISSLNKKNIIKPEALNKINSIQINIAAKYKWKEKYIDQILNQYIEETQKNITSKTTTILWPETALNFYPQIKNKRTELLTNFAKQNNIIIYAGGPEYTKIGKNYKFYNSIFKISKDEIKSVYKKEKLIAFAEYAPAKFLYPIFKKLIGKNEFSSSKYISTNSKIGFAICFESTFPATIKERAKNSELLIILSDDIWLGNTPGPTQHLATMVLRAIENKKYLISCVNSGPSVIIDTKGNILTKLKFGQTGTLNIK